MKRRRQAGCLALLFLILLSCLALATCAARFFQVTQRVPELPVQQFLQQQLAAFPSTWSLGKPQIWTDTDFTWAGWAVVVHFEYQDGLEFAREEIHIFRNAFVAQITPAPSPPSIGAGEGYRLVGWTYRPPHADRFEFGCSGGDGRSQPESCSLILRYAEYIIVFATPIGDHMSLDDLQRVLAVIDQEMSSYLQTSSLRPGPREVPSTLDR